MECGDKGAVRPVFVDEDGATGWAVNHCAGCDEYSLVLANPNVQEANPRRFVVTRTIDREALARLRDALNSELAS